MCIHVIVQAKHSSILWLNLVPKVLWEMRAKHMIGCVSIGLEGNEARAYHTHQAFNNWQKMNAAIFVTAAV